MLSFFKSDKSGLIAAHQVALVSVHIPKTAGTSFRNTLQAVYGESAVARLDINLGSKDIKFNEQAFTAHKVPSSVRVVHGHFCPADLQATFALQPEVPYITWLRDPVDRVASNYYYLAKRLAEELDESGRGLNILSKMQRTLMEYARAKNNCNRMSRFLNGISLTQLAFVGIVEHYHEDLAELSRLLNWPHAPEYKYNTTGTSYHLTADERAEIAELNREDMALYQTALELREQRKTML